MPSLSPTMSKVSAGHLIHEAYCMRLRVAHADNLVCAGEHRQMESEGG